MALTDFKLYRPGQPSLPRLARLLQNNQQRLQQSVWGEDGHHKCCEIGVRLLNSEPLSTRIRLISEENAVVLLVSSNPALYLQLEELLSDAQTYRTFTRHSILRFLADHGIELDYTC